jgi:hypothetical protein
MRWVVFAYLKLLSRNYMWITEKKLIKSLAGIRAENCRYSNDNALPLYHPACWNHFFLTFMGPCIVNIFKYNQQDATLHNSIYYYKCSTCFRRLLRPSSGAQNCIHSIRYLSRFFCFLLLLWVSYNLPTQAVRSSKSSKNTRCCVYSFELLMMGGGTAWNIYSIYSNKYHCVTLHLGVAWIH